MVRRFAIYYKTLPMGIDAICGKDDSYSFVKDGASISHGIACARGIITAELKNDHTDKEKISKIERLLETLLKNNQIFDYLIIKG